MVSILSLGLKFQALKYNWGINLDWCLFYKCTYFKANHKITWYHGNGCHIFHFIDCFNDLFLGSEEYCALCIRFFLQRRNNPQEVSTAYCNSPTLLSYEIPLKNIIQKWCMIFITRNQTDMAWLIFWPQDIFILGPHTRFECAIPLFVCRYFWWYKGRWKPPPPPTNKFQLS